MPIIKYENKDTGYIYDIISSGENIASTCGKIVRISKIGSSTCVFDFDLVTGKPISGRETATNQNDFLDAYCYVDLYKKTWQKESGLHHIVKFSENSNCYYDFGSKKLYNAYGQKNNKRIEGNPTKFTPTEQRIVEYLVNMVNWPCEYEDIIASCCVGSESALQVHINHIKNYDEAICQSITNINGCYIYNGQKEVYFFESKEAQNLRISGSYLLNYGKALFDKGIIEKIAFLTSNNAIEVHNVSDATLSVICNFFFPGAVAWSDNNLTNIGSSESSDRTLLIQYINNVCNSPEKEWDESVKYIKAQLRLAVQVDLFRRLQPRGDNSIPKTKEALSSISDSNIDPNLEAIFDDLVKWIPNLVNKDTYINKTFFAEREVDITNENLLDAVAALSWINLYRELLQKFPFMSDHLKNYKMALTKNIKSIFFPPETDQQNYSEEELFYALKCCLEQMEDTDKKKTFKEGFNKFYYEYLKPNKISKNNEIRLSQASNSNENGSLSKSL